MDVEEDIAADPSGFAALLGQSDAALEPEIGLILRELVDSGGNLSDAKRQLQEGYVGMPNLCNTMQACMDAMNGSEEKGRPEALASVVHTHYQSVLSQMLASSGQQQGSRGGELSEEDMQGWVAVLMGDKSWRQVLVDMHKQHPQSKLLHALRKRVRLEQEGEESVEDMSMTAFTGVLVEQLLGLLAVLLDSPQEELVARLEAPTRAFYAKCSQNEWTYLFTQCVLQSGPLRSTPSIGFFFDTLSRGLSDAASALSEHKSAVRRLDLSVRNAFTANRQVSKVLSGFPAKGALTSGEVAVIWQHYQARGEGEGGELLPLLSEICYEQLFRCLLSALCREGAQVAANARRHVWEPNLKLLVAISASSSSSSSSPSASAAQRALESVLTVVGDTANLTLKAKEYYQSLDDALTTVPVAAALVLEYINREFTSANYWEQPHEGLWTTALFALMHKTISLYRHERPRVLDMLVVLLNASVSPDAKHSRELHASIFSLFTHLIHHGLIEQVVAAVCARADKTERSMLRNFVRTTLASISPPYSRHFCLEFTRLLQNVSVGKALEGGTEISDFLALTSSSSSSSSAPEGDDNANEDLGLGDVLSDSE